MGFFDWNCTLCLQLYFIIVVDSYNTNSPGIKSQMLQNKFQWRKERKRNIFLVSFSLILQMRIQNKGRLTGKYMKQTNKERLQTASIEN